MKEPFTLNLELSGTPTMTSVCGGKGPYTAKIWAERKSVVCPERPEFAAIVKLIVDEGRKRKQSSFDVSVQA